MNALKADIKIRLPNDLKRCLEKIAEERDVPASIIYREAIQEFLAKRGVIWLKLERKRKGAA